GGGAPSGVSRRAPDQPLGEALERGFEVGGAGGLRRVPGDDHHVDPHGPTGPTDPEGLTDVTPDARAHHRVAHLGRDGDAQPRRLLVRAGQDQRQQDAVAELATTSLNAHELPPAQQPRRFGQRVAGEFVRTVGGPSGIAGCEATANGYFLKAETTRRLRPLARRRLSTSRPALVAFRFRNP